MIALGWPLELYQRNRMAAYDDIRRPIESSTQFYNDCQAAELLGKSLEEFYELSDVEQIAWPLYLSLKSEKESYFSRPKKDRVYWPNEAPKDS